MHKLFAVMVFVLPVGLVFSFWLNIGNWLAREDAPGPADLVVCLSFSEERLDTSLALLRTGQAEFIAATTDKTLHALGGRRGTAGRVLATAHSAKSTYEEAVFLQAVIEKGQFKKVIVVSDPHHLYRSRWVFADVYQGQDISFSFISCDPPWARGFWWDNRKSRFFVLMEIPKTVYYRLWHGLLGEAYDPAWALRLEKQYYKMVVRLFGGKSR